MNVTLLIAIAFIVAGPTLVFYAAHAPGSLAAKTVLAFVGFLLVGIALYLVGALG
jgi:hypothetical protein